LYEKADLAGAMRFRAETFKNALTSVVTDLVILRKRLSGEKPRSDLWTQTEEMPDQADGKPIQLKSYLAAFPEKMR
jgi:predicted site-specific integrase-resolvase